MYQGGDGFGESVTRLKGRLCSSSNELSRLHIQKFMGMVEMQRTQTLMGALSPRGMDPRYERIRKRKKIEH